MPVLLSRLCSPFLPRAMCLAAFCAVPAAAQSANDVQAIANLVVVVKSTLPGQAPETAGGIIFGTSANRLYIVTTNHTVRQGADVVADRIEVTCRWAPSRPLRASLLNTSDTALDVAVLSVETAPPGVLRFDLTGNPAALARGDALAILGHSGAKNWTLSLQSNAFSGLDGIHLYFQSPFDPVMSGVAVLNDQGGLIGMLRNGQPPRLEAVNIDTVLRWLSGNGYAVDLRPVGVAGKLSELEDSMEADVAFACGYVAAFGTRVLGADEQAKVKNLALLRQKVEADSRFYGVRSFIIGQLYRCLGGSYLIDGNLEMADKLNAAIPNLTRSLEYYPDQPLLEKNLAYFKSIRRTGEITVDPRVFATNVFQAVQGRDSPAIARLVEQMTHYMGDAEYLAQQWVMNEATNPTFMSMMEAVQMMGKNQAHQDWTVDVTSKKLPNGLVEVKATVGPNIFVWNVDYRRKRFAAQNEMTQKIADIIASSKK